MGRKGGEKVERVCRYCKKVFIERNNKNKKPRIYCCFQCWKDEAARKRIIFCDHCGRLYYRGIKELHKTTCTRPACKTAKKIKPRKQCLNCGKPVTGKNAKFCCWECSQIYYGAHFQKKDNCVCDWCNKSFWKAPSQIKISKHHFCSQGCFKKFAKSLRKDKPPKKYSLSNSLRWHVLERDNFTCVYCGASRLKDKSLVLHVDHVIPRCEDGQDVLSNLVTACEECNLGKHGDLLKFEHKPKIQGIQAKLPF